MLWHLRHTGDAGMRCGQTKQASTLAAVTCSPRKARSEEQRAISPGKRTPRTIPAPAKKLSQTRRRESQCGPTPCQRGVRLLARRMPQARAWFSPVGLRSGAGQEHGHTHTLAMPAPVRGHACLGHHRCHGIHASRAGADPRPLSRPKTYPPSEHAACLQPWPSQPAASTEKKPPRSCSRPGLLPLMRI